MNQIAELDRLNHASHANLRMHDGLLPVGRELSHAEFLDAACSGLLELADADAEGAWFHLWGLVSSFVPLNTSFGWAHAAISCLQNCVYKKERTLQ